MKVTLSTDAAINVKADLLAVPVRASSPLRDPLVKKLDSTSRGKIKEMIRLEKYEGKPGETLKIGAPGLSAKRLLLVGVADEDPTEASARAYASAAARAGRSYRTLAVVPPSTDPLVVRGAVSGAVMGAYRYTTYLTGDRVPARTLSAVKLLVDKSERRALREPTNHGVALGESVNHARDLVNAPPNDLNPITLANFAKEQAALHDLECTIWDKKAIKKAKMELFLAVNRGSGIDPRLIHLVYKPENPKAKVVFVGKGLTFDAGGLCLKPPKSMLDMKCDMGGAATTLGVVFAASRLGLPIEVHALIGSTENMTGADAYRPGDVFTSRDGKTVEIINTDAEGRLVLADVLAYARELGGDYLVDHATLTGACMVALGPWTAGLYSNDAAAGAAYVQAASDAGESVWQMPLDSELRDMLKSDIADLKHTGERAGGSITAALFLSEFIGDSKWVHLDIAGPAFIDRPHGTSPKGGTGFGVLTGVSFVEGLAREVEREDEEPAEG